MSAGGKTSASHGALTAGSPIAGRLPAAWQRFVDAIEGERGWVALAILVVASIAATMYFSRGTTFWFDEIDFFESDRGFDPGVLLAPHNGQLIAGARVIYAAIFKLFGADYTAIRMVEAIGIALVGVLVYALVRPRVGGFVALVTAAVLLFFGSAWDVTLTSNGILNVYCVAAVIAALLVLDRRPRHGDSIACALLIAAVATWSFGIAAAVGVGVGVLLGGKDRWRRSWVFLIPLVLYAVWYLLRSHFHAAATTSAITAHASNALLIPNFAARSAAAAAAALTGTDYSFTQPAVGGPAIDPSWGAPLMLIALGALAYRLWRRPGTVTLWMWSAVLLAFWALVTLGLTPLRIPESGRYIYPAAVMLVLVAAEAAAGARLRRTALFAVAAVGVAALATNVYLERSAGNYLRGYSASLRADLTALELARARVPASFVPGAGSAGSGLFGGSLTAGLYLGAVDRIGSPADSLDELRAAPEPLREEADAILTQALGVGLRRLAAPPSGGCRTVTAHDDAPVTAQLPPGGAVLRSAGGGQVTLRRFGSVATAQAGELAPGQYEKLTIPTDAAPDPWWVSVTPSGTLTVCTP